jgi:DNA (cytosine-5)-methyltransferase 1
VNETVISLFCGAGGCSLGFIQAGYKVLLANDIDRVVLDSYARNFPQTKVLHQDITKIDFHKLLKNAGLMPEELDVLIGGPPCQGFSTAGMRFWDDPRNGLLKSYVVALGIIRPKWFLIENVEGLLTAKDGDYVYEAVKAMIEIGYFIRLEKVYAQEYGVPQRRKRVFVVGNRIGKHFRFPRGAEHLQGRIFRRSSVTLRHAIGDLPKPSETPDEFLSYQNCDPMPLEKYLRGSSTRISDHYSPALTAIQLERIRALKPGQTMKDLPENLQHDSFKRRANRRVMDGTPTEKRGGAPSGLKRLVYDEPCLTITGAATREFIHPEQDRPLTVRECARIQTFPDDFAFCGNAAERIQQIGNAIPPQIAKIFADHIRLQYGFEREGIDSKGKFLGFCLTKAEAMSPALQKTAGLLESFTQQPKQGVLF